MYLNNFLSMHKHSSHLSGIRQQTTSRVNELKIGAFSKMTCVTITQYVCTDIQIDQFSNVKVLLSLLSRTIQVAGCGKWTFSHLKSQDPKRARNEQIFGGFLFSTVCVVVGIDFVVGRCLLKTSCGWQGVLIEGI